MVCDSQNGLSMTDPVISDVANSQLEPSLAFAELGRISHAENDLTGVLARVADLAKACIPGATEVSVTLINHGSPGTVAATGALAEDVDEKQYEVGYGPCLDAARSHQIYLIPDMSDEPRWPEFARRAFEAGVRSSLSAGIPIQEAITGALNVYSVQPNAFDEESAELLNTFAGYAAVALANAHLYATTAALAKQMAQAMETRAVIEQAKGILIAQRHVSPDEAFVILARASQVGNRKLREIAQAIVDGTSQTPNGSSSTS
jgi:GAF domain-containing protein